MKKSVGEGDNAKDAPAWALPLMSAGFAMMASKSPNFLQALGEGGQEGIKTLTAQQEGKLEKEKSEAEMEQSKAMAAYYRGEGKQGAPNIKVLNYQGRPVLHRYDTRLNRYVPMLDESGLPQTAIPTDAEIAATLASEMENWSYLSLEEQRKAIEQRKNLLLGILEKNLTNVPSEDAGPGWLEKGWEGLKEGLTKAKDGGIVSLRRQNDTSRTDTGVKSLSGINPR